MISLLVKRLKRLKRLKRPKRPKRHWVKIMIQRCLRKVASAPERAVSVGGLWSH